MRGIRIMIDRTRRLLLLFERYLCISLRWISVPAKFLIMTPFATVSTDYSSVSSGIMLTATVVAKTGMVVLLLLVVTASTLTLSWVCFVLLSLYFDAFQLGTNLGYLRNNCCWVSCRDCCWACRKLKSSDLVGCELISLNAVAKSFSGTSFSIIIIRATLLHKSFTVIAVSSISYNFRRIVAGIPLRNCSLTREIR